MALPKTPFLDWFDAQGWHPHGHQLALLEDGGEGTHDLLIAPTGGGKTLAGFLPSLVDLHKHQGNQAGGRKPGHKGVHTLYVSPLKALAVDIARNLQRPVAEMGLDIRIDTRTGDTPSHRRTAQKRKPPHILLTTPESLALMLSYGDADTFLGSCKRVVIDEIHALADNKRGAQLALGLARLRRLSPLVKMVGLSATVADPDALAAWMVPDPSESHHRVRILNAGFGPKPDAETLQTKAAPPWSGHSGRYAMTEIMAEIATHKTTVIFVNTRSQAEHVFQELWSRNDDALPIALHHGSLAKDQRLKVEAAMASGALRCVVATSSLDLGVDWAAVDLVIQVGAPKGISRMVQRIGRANHRLDEPSRALFVPTNRFEVLECRAALDAIAAGEMDGQTPPPGGLDVLAQHILLMACAGPLVADEFYAEITSAGPYAALTRAAFDDALAFCAHGGYALRAYDQWQRLVEGPKGTFTLRTPAMARRLRMNSGTIVEAESLNVKRKRGPFVGTVEEAFVQALGPGDTFVLGGQVWQFDRMKDLSVEVVPAKGRDPKVPTYAGGKFPINTALAHRVLSLLEDPSSWAGLSAPVREWLELQQAVSELPSREDLLIETYPRADKWYMTAYTFAGRNAHQTLGLLVTRRMEETGLAPLGFVADDYGITCWGLRPVDAPESLFDPAGIHDGMEAWLADSALLKRTFRQTAVVGGLIERRFPGKQKTGKQVTFNSDIIYETLRRHEPDHLLLRATRQEAMGGLVDLSRIEELLMRIDGRVRHVRRHRVTPLALPLMLAIGREPIRGGAGESALLAEAEAEALISDALTHQASSEDGPQAA